MFALGYFAVVSQLYWCVVSCSITVGTAGGYSVLPAATISSNYLPAGELSVGIWLVSTSTVSS